MDDLVERLKGWAKDIQLGRDCFGADQDIREAANEIERLRFERMKLRSAFRVNMLRSFPEISHEHIDKLIKATETE